MTDDPDLAAARAATYEALSRILDGDVELLVEARTDADGLQSVARSLGVDPEPLVRETSREALGRSYDALFAVPGPRYVPPYASAHLGDPHEDAPSSPSAFARTDGGRLGGTPARRTKALYARFGFTPTRGDGMPDHVAAQLEFAARLATAEGEGVDVARSELEDVLGWLESFETRLERQDELGVYTGVVSLARALVDEHDGRQ